MFDMKIGIRPILTVLVAAAAISLLTGCVGGATRPNVSASDPETMSAEAVWVKAVLQLRRDQAESDQPLDWMFATWIPDLYREGPDDEMLSGKIEQFSPTGSLAQLMGGAQDSAAFMEDQLDSLYIQDRYGSDREHEISALLAEMSEADVFDGLAGWLMKSQLDLYDRMRVTIPDGAMSHDDFVLLKHDAAFGRTFGLELIGYSPLVKLCDPDDERFIETRRTDCVEIARKMIVSPGALQPRIRGVQILRQMRAEVPDSGLSLHEALWLQEQALILQARLSSQPAKIAEIDADWQATADEIEVYRRLLTREGIALSPPDDIIRNDRESADPEVFDGPLSDIKFAEALDDARIALADALRANDDPFDKLMAATLLIPDTLSGSQDQRIEMRRDLFRPVIAVAPENAAVVQLALRFGGDAVDRDALIDRLVDMEPENLSTWFYAVSEKPLGEQGQIDVDDVLLSKAAESRFYRNYMDEYVRRLLTELERLSDFIAEESDVGESDIALYQYSLFNEIYAYGLSGDILYSAFMPFCSPLRPGFRLERQAPCMRIMQTLTATPSTWSDGLLGLTTLGYLGGEPSPGVRQFRWLMDANFEVRQIFGLWPFSTRQIRQELNDWKAGGNEIAVAERIMRRAGISLMPPVNWDSAMLREYEKRKATAGFRLKGSAEEAFSDASPRSDMTP